MVTRQSYFRTVRYSFLYFFYHSRNLKNIFNFFYGGANSGSNTDDTKDDR